MKRIKSINGYTIYQATERDEQKYNVTADTYYIYFSSDIRDYGLSYSEPDWEADTIENALDWCTSSNYAIAKEIAEANTTAATFEEIEAIERKLDAGISAEEIQEEEADQVNVIEENGLFFVHVENSRDYFDHGPYFTHQAAQQAAENYKINTMEVK